MLNVLVKGDENGFVLIRALEPVSGIGATTHGPGLLCRALHIDRELNGVSLRQAPLWIERPAAYRRPRIARSERIGVDYAGDWALKPWRFYLADSRWVSRAPRRRGARASAIQPRPGRSPRRGSDGGA